ncbi:MAG: hypothetical protein IID37_04900, partial [Planctomycetes bacterium]|nr:hypothetical protein [Planctomycetota bacterium]
MGRQLAALKRVLKAIPIAARDGAMEAGKVSPAAAFGLTFLKGLHDACRNVPADELATAAEDAGKATDKQIITALKHFETESTQHRDMIVALLRAIFQRVSEHNGELPALEEMAGSLSQLATMPEDVRAGFAHLHHEITTGFKELAVRSEHIAEDTAETHDIVKRIAGQTQKDSASFEREYAEAVAATLDEMELFGIDPRIDPSARKQRLTIAYLTLNLTDERGQDQAPTPFEGLLSQMDPLKKNKILIRGDAGSGKTTLLKWAAIHTARGLLSDRGDAQFTYRDSEARQWADIVWAPGARGRIARR